MSRRTIYWIVGGVLALLLVIMMVTYNYNRAGDEALAKAQQLIAAFDKAGLRSPADPKRVAAVLGTDGGTICAAASDGVGSGIARLLHRLETR